MRQNSYLFVRQFPARSLQTRGFQAHKARAASALLVAVAASCALSQTAHATNYVVDLAGDGTQNACTSAANDCSLRGAIIAANANTGTDSIELAAGQTYALSLGGSDSEINARVPATGDLDITDSLTIQGNGATVNGGGIDRVFDIGNASGTALSVTMSDLTISGGVAKGMLSYGGGINVRGAALSLARCVVSGNSSGTFNGGGIAVNSVRSSAQAASLSLSLCTVENNSGYNGGGIEAGSASVSISQSLLRNNTASGTFGGGGLFVCGSSATASLSNSTLFENKSSSNGGGIAIFAGTLNVQHSTIASNSASGSGARGGGIDNGAGQGGVLNVSNSVLAGNTGGDGAGTLVGDYNLIQSASGLIISGANNITGQDPNLGALALNGGTTQSLAPQLGSPLIDKAGPSSLIIDQRNATRPFDFSGVANASGGNGSDIGAVEAQNIAPTLTDIAFVTNEDAPRAFAANNFDNAFTDANSDTAQSVRIVSLPTGGVLTLDGVAVVAAQTIARADFAKLSYAPNANFNGSDSFVYNVSDGALFAASNANVNITVSSVNDAPSFSLAGPQTINEDAGAQNVALFATSLSAGPANESGQTLSFNVTNSNNALFSSQPAINASGVLTYTPAPNVFGVATVSVALSDDGSTTNGGADTSATQTFTVTVNAVNDAPSFTLGASQTINEDAGAQSVANFATNLSAGPANESGQMLSFNVTNSNNALFSSQPAINASGVLTYAPAPNAFGVATVSVTLQDNGNTANGGINASATQTFTITVNAVNDAPSFTVGVNQTINEDAGAQSVTNFATNLSAGPANESDQTLTFNVTNSNNALFSSQPTISTSGTLSYTPAPNVFGVATVSVALSDDGSTTNGGADTSATQTFTITVNAVNDAPSFTVGASQTINEDTGAQSVANFATNLSAGPANESAQKLSFTVTTDNENLFSVVPTISASGTLSYTPALNANGVATVSVTLQDDGNTANGGANASATQTFTITVNAVNDAPSFTVGANQTINEDAGVQSVANFATNLSAGPANESGQTLSFTVTNNNNALFSSQPTISASGVLSYTSAPNASGSATVSVTLQDNGSTANGGTNVSATQTFTITVSAVNDAPTITGIGNQIVNEDAKTGALSFTIGDVETATSALSVTATSSNASLVPNAGLVLSGDAAERTLTVTPAPNANGTATITVTVSDGSTSKSTSFELQINAVNDAPSFTVGANQTINEDAGAQSVANFATNLSAGPANESAQTLSFSVTNNNNALFSSQPAISASGTLSYTPAPNAFGDATVSVTLQDDGGTVNGGVNASATQTFTITVNAVNDAPVAVSDNYQIGEDTALTVAAAEGVLSNDSDVDNSALQAVLISGPANGTLTLNKNGGFSYTPNANFNGRDTFSYQANNGALNSNTVTVTITVGAANDAPVASAQSISTNEDSAAPVVLRATDLDNANLTYRVVTAPKNGTLSGNAPNLTYTPNANFNGADSFTFLANDGALDSNTATVSIAVKAVNDAPIAVADAYALDQNTTLTVPVANGVLKNDSDVDNTTLSAVLDTGVAHGTLTLNANGSFTYVPTVGYRGNDSFSYHANDGALKSAVVTVNLTVNATPQPINFGVSLNPKAPATNSVVTATPIILDGNGVSFSYVWSVNGVVKQIGAQNTLDLAKAGNGDKDDRVSVVVTATRDIDGGTATSFVQVINSAPFAFSQSGAAQANVPTRFTLRGADLDAETLTYKRVGGPNNGSASIVNNADGSATLTYTGRADFGGVEVIRFVSVDEIGRSSAPATLAINVTRVTPAPIPNRAPSANNVTASTKSGVEVAIPLGGSDPDGDALTFKRVGGPSNGTGEIRRDVDGIFKMFYTPRASFVGNEIIRFVALDTAGKPSPVATMTINVSGSSSASGALRSAPSAGNS